MMRVRAWVGVLVVVLWGAIGVSAASASAGDWPQLGFGPAHNGYQPSETVLSASSVGHLRWSWHRPVGFVYGSPSVVGNVVYVEASRDLPGWTNSLVALDRLTGRTLWSRQFGQGQEPVYTTPVVANGLVYATVDGLGASPGRLWAFDAVTGALHWSSAVRLPGQSTLDQLVSSPTYADGMVLVSANAMNTSLSMVSTAFDATTGAVRWQTLVPYADGNVPGTPAVAQGRVVFATGGAGGLVAIDEATGHTLYNKFVCNPSEFKPTLVVASGVILYPCNGGGLRAIDLATGTPRWKTFTGSTNMAVFRPVVHHGVVYTTTQPSFGTPPTRLAAVRLKDGSRIWSTIMPKPGLRPTTFSPAFAMANGLLYGTLDTTITGSGLVVYRAATGRLLRIRGLGASSGTVWSNPVVSNGQVFVGSDTGVYAFAYQP